jgi:hypothetical protein
MAQLQDVNNSLGALANTIDKAKQHVVSLPSPTQLDDVVANINQLNDRLAAVLPKA